VAKSIALWHKFYFINVCHQKYFARLIAGAGKQTYVYILEIRNPLSFHH